MYYDDLTNTELRTYHHYAQMDSISACLSYMQNSDLFKVQSLGNNVYKIYPLFYIDEIRCNESNAKILDNKCVILIETENTASSQTYINFISKQNDGIIYQYDNTNRNNTSSTIPTLQVGDTLTESAYNNLVQVIRDNVILNNPIKILDGVVTGKYGEYDFNIKDVSLVDNGILVTDETITNGLTCTLLDPIYKYSTYELILSVAKIKDVHLDSTTANTQYTDIIPLTVTLTPFEEVTIPLTTLEPNTVILYDATVQVTHDKPYIQQIDEFKEFRLTYNQYLLKNNTLTAKYLTETLAGNTITFKTKKVDTESYITLGTATTDNEGIATLTFTPLNKGMSTGRWVYYAEIGNITTTSNAYNYKNYSTKLTIDTTYNYTTGYLTINGSINETLNNTGVPYTSATAYIVISKDGVSFSNYDKTFTGSAFTQDMHLGSAGNYSISIGIGGTAPSGYNNPSNKTVSYRVKTDTTLTITDLYQDSYGSHYYIGTNGYLKDENNQAVANRNITATFKDSNDNSTTLTGVTDNNGYFSIGNIWDNLVVRVDVTFDGDTQYNGSTAYRLRS